MVCITKSIGDVSEAYVKSRFLELGWTVLQPMGDNQRYDCVIDRGNGFERIQIKTALIRSGAVQIKMFSAHNHVNSGNKKYVGQVEFIAAWEPVMRKVYMVPVMDQYGVCLRLDPPKNKQVAGTRLAKDYEI